MASPAGVGVVRLVGCVGGLWWRRVVADSLLMTRRTSIAPEWYVAMYAVAIHRRPVGRAVVQGAHLLVAPHAHVSGLVADLAPPAFQGGHHTVTAQAPVIGVVARQSGPMTVVTRSAVDVTDRAVLWDQVESAGGESPAMGALELTRVRRRAAIAAILPMACPTLGGGPALGVTAHASAHGHRHRSVQSLRLADIAVAVLTLDAGRAVIVV